MPEASDRGRGIPGRSEPGPERPGPPGPRAEEADAHPGDEAPVVRVADPAGSYRRRIRMVTTEPGVVIGGLEDDFHYFEIELRHADGIVTNVDASSRRWPWSTCPAAGNQLHALEGMPLSPRCTAVAKVADPRMNCTHQFDLAGLCVAHAGRDDTVRQYDVELPGLRDGVTHPRLARDGEPLLEWTLAWEGYTRRLVDPPPYSDAPWQGGFIRWADEHFDPLTAEAAIVLRRSCEIGMGRGMDLEAYETAADIGEYQVGICYSQQPGINTVAFRTTGTIRDFDRHPDALLRHTPDAATGPRAAPLTPRLQADEVGERPDPVDGLGRPPPR